jgi:L-asparagine permease
MAISGWQSSPYLSHKVNFLVVVFGIPLIAIALFIGWKLVKPKVVENTGGKIEAVWSNDGPTYGPDVSPDDLDVAEHDPATAGRNLMDLNEDGSFVGDEDGKEKK